MGGGPAGLAAAIAARRKGFRVTVADSAVPPIDKACGEGLMPDALAALARLHIRIPATDAYPFRGIRFLESGLAVDASFPTGTGLGIRRTALHRIMVERAEQAGVAMFWGATVNGISSQGVRLGEEAVRCRWIVGADGGQSRVRGWAGLDRSLWNGRRFGFRRHYRVAPWTDCMELYWGDACQVYVTPVGADEVCVAMLSKDPQRRLEEALRQFPEILERLAGADRASAQRGAITASRRLQRVSRGRVALIGDASGSVDAITGEGLCLAFQQALALADSLESGDLRAYQEHHARIARRPTLMAALMLAMDDRRSLRRRAMRALASQPRIFARMLAMHVGALSPLDFAVSGLALGRRMLTG